MAPSITSLDSLITSQRDNQSNAPWLNIHASSLLAKSTSTPSTNTSSESSMIGQDSEVPRYTVELPYNYTSIFKELWDDGEAMVDWNPQVESFRYLKKIGNNVTIGYQITSPIAYGLLSQRDFVAVAHFEAEEETKIRWLTIVSVKYSGMPEQKDYVRGLHLPGSGVKLEASPDSPDDKTIFTWIMIPDLKFGYIPKSIIKKVLPSQIKLYYESLRKRMSQLYPSHRFNGNAAPAPSALVLSPQLQKEGMRYQCKVTSLAERV
ncbi:unnamed protein product [Cyprideis torosa]|uniref:Uncharacterized protein n=1 Tax=Cyprideis torosa TaxID=163714 RepID=A0A7R8WLT7_9CRUS|nr:unnamed protein product [Cyprideis torosa]CAG0897656.1 unnamed protein product [Cyprideis torosa]